MLKLFKTLKEYKSNKNNYETYLTKKESFDNYEESKDHFDLFKLEQDKFNEYNSKKELFLNYEKNKDKFDEFLQHGESFLTYKNIIGENRPHFLMYASEVDQEGNVTFNYDFSKDFVKLLRKQGIQGIEDLEVIEAYLHYIFSQNYFSEMFHKEEEDK